MNISMIQFGKSMSESLKNSKNQLSCANSDFEKLFGAYIEGVAGDKTSTLNIKLSDNIYKRIAAIVTADQKTKTWASSVLEKDKYFFNRYSMTNGSLTKGQLKDIENFWKPYSFVYKNNPETQRIYTSISGRFDPSYVSLGLHYYILKNMLDTTKASFICDKNSYGMLFPEVKQPAVVFRRLAGGYFDSSMAPISASKAKGAFICALYEKGYDLIVKPSRGHSGKGIKIIAKSLHKCMSENIFEKCCCSGDVICQVVIKNHDTWKYSVDCTALNVARINTINFGGHPEITSSLFNIQIDEGKIVSEALGAFSVPILYEGTLDSMMYSLGKVTLCKRIPSGSRGLQKLYKFEEAKNIILKCAAKIPELKSVGWDVTVDENGDINLIDINTPSSIVSMQAFGFHPYGDEKRFKKMLDDYLLKKFHYECSDWEWDYWEFYRSVSIHKYNGIKQEIEVPRMLSGKAVTAIHANAFVGKQLKKITVPDSVRLISERAFASCPKECEINMPCCQKLLITVYKMIRKMPHGNTIIAILENSLIELNIMKVNIFRAILRIKK